MDYNDLAALYFELYQAGQVPDASLANTFYICDTLGVKVGDFDRPRFTQAYADVKQNARMQALVMG